MLEGIASGWDSWAPAAAAKSAAANAYVHPQPQATPTGFPGAPGPHGPPGMGDDDLMGATGKDPDHRGQRVFWDTKLFDEKMTLNPLYRYNGVSGGDVWHTRIFDYMVSKCPDIEVLLRWAEKQDMNLVTENHIRSTVHDGGSASGPVRPHIRFPRGLS